MAGCLFSQNSRDRDPVVLQQLSNEFYSDSVCLERSMHGDACRSGANVTVSVDAQRGEDAVPDRVIRPAEQGGELPLVPGAG